MDESLPVGLGRAERPWERVVDQDQFALAHLAVQTERYQEAISRLQSLLFSTEYVPDRSAWPRRPDRGKPSLVAPIQFPLSPVPTVRDVSLLLAESLYMSGQLDECLAFCARALQTGALAPDEVYTDLLKGWVLMRRGQVHPARELVDRNLKRGPSSLPPAIQAGFLHLRGVCDCQQGRFETALCELRDAVALYRQARQWGGEAEALNALAVTEFVAGRLPTAASQLEQAMRLNEKLGTHYRLAANMLHLAIVHMKSGYPEKALPLLDKARHVNQTRQSHQVLARIQICRAKALLQLGRSGEARREAHPALELAMRNKFPREEALALETIGDVALLENRPETALRCYERGTAVARRFGDKADLVAGLLRRMGQVRTAQGDICGAVALLRKAIRAAQAGTERYEEGVATRLLATLYRELGQWRRAYETCRKAVGVVREFGAELELAHCRLEAARIQWEWWRSDQGARDPRLGKPGVCEKRKPGQPARRQRAHGKGRPAQDDRGWVADGPGRDLKDPAHQVAENCASACLAADGTPGLAQAAPGTAYPSGQLEIAWSYVIEAFHGYADLGREEESRSCTALMDRMREEGQLPWCGPESVRHDKAERPEQSLPGRRIVRRLPRGSADLRVLRQIPPAGAPLPSGAADQARTFVATSPVMRHLLELIEIAADSREPVLITGETGTGKELVARLVHGGTDSRPAPFVAINCAAIPETLFEREFFGHRKGAFTGADHDKAGLCEHADGGTLFLDEVGEMPPFLQAKLLRLLQEGTFRRLGEVEERRVDLRVIAATNADLKGMIGERRFRQDLYYRLQILELSLPPLRERGEEIGPLMELFVGQAAGAGVMPGDIFDEDVLVALHRYPWPGNVRELESMTRRLALLAAHTGKATAGMLPPEIARWRKRPSAVSKGMTLARYLEQAERERIAQALTQCEGNRSEAARILGISRNTLYKKMEKLEIRIPT